MPARYAYDGLDHVVRASHGGTSHTHTYAWDACGNRNARSTPQGSEKLAIDPVSNRVASHTSASQSLRPRSDWRGGLESNLFPSDQGLNHNEQ